MKFPRFFRRRRPVEEHTDALDQRLHEVEEGHRQIVEPEREELLRRLRYLELQAEVIARQKRLRFDNGEH